MDASATLTDQIRELLSDSRRNGDFEVELCALLVAAVTGADEQALRLVAKRLSVSDDGYAVLGELAEQALAQLHSLAPAQQIEAGSHAHRFLTLIAGSSGLSNGELVDQLATDETEVSRTGRKLLEGGYAVRQKVGRRNAWSITARGLAVLDLLG